MKWDEKTLKTKNVRIYVTNRHIDDKGKWVCSVAQLSWSCKRIGVPDTATQEEAQDAAVNMVKQHLHTMIAELS